MGSAGSVYYPACYKEHLSGFQLVCCYVLLANSFSSFRLHETLEVACLESQIKQNEYWACPSYHGRNAVFSWVAAVSLSALTFVIHQVGAWIISREMEMELDEDSSSAPFRPDPSSAPSIPLSIESGVFVAGKFITIHRLHRKRHISTIVRSN
ncbi:hypothetical protein Droror1_Dr00003639 [Drosera rotundifolia]